MSTSFVCDKSPLVIPFVLQLLKKHLAGSSAPFFIGLNGVQGAGKTTLVTSLLDQLRQPPYSLHPLAFSIDDLYLPYSQLQSLAAANPDNPLLQQRGQPGTHDIELGSKVFAAIKNKAQNIAIPSYDKSAHSGKGDRAASDTWHIVNKPGEAPIDVVLFEGWSVGFRALSDSELEAKFQSASEALRLQGTSGPNDIRKQGRLGNQLQSNLQTINDSLKSYDVLTDQLDAFVYIDAEDTNYVYDWRLEQESKLRLAKGTGMTDDQVITFVNGYYPSYELYADRLRAGIFPNHPGQQLHLKVGRDRKVLEHHII